MGSEDTMPTALWAFQQLRAMGYEGDIDFNTACLMANARMYREFGDKWKQEYRSVPPGKYNDMMRNDPEFRGMAVDMMLSEVSDFLIEIEVIDDSTRGSLSVLYPGYFEKVAEVKKEALPLVLAVTEKGHRSDDEMRWAYVSGVSAKMRSLKAKLLKVQGKLPEIKPTSYTQNNSSSGGCYVATAVYGSYDCPQVWTLRRFRDYDLAETRHGRAFIKAYYAVSPMLVRWFGDTVWFKKMWRGSLDRLVAKCKANGYEDTPYQDRVW